MGNSRLIRFLIKIETVLSRQGKSFYHPFEWRVKDSGKPTESNLDEWVRVFENSCLPGGCNQHLGVDPVLSAKIIDQRKGSLLCTWNRSSRKEPLFQVIN